MLPKIRRTISINCLDTEHKISVTFDGDLIFHNHPTKTSKDIALWKICQALEEDAPPCVKLLNSWQRFLKNPQAVGWSEARDKIPPDLIDIVSHNMGRRFLKHEKYRVNNFLRSNDEETSRYVSRYVLTKHRFIDAFLKCHYLLTPLVNLKFFLSRGINIDPCYVEFIKYRALTKIRVVLPDDWLESVSKKDIAVVDGHLVVYAEPENNNIFKSLALRHEENNFVTRRCIIINEPSNKRIYWTE